MTLPFAVLQQAAATGLAENLDKANKTRIEQIAELIPAGYYLMVYKPDSDKVTKENMGMEMFPFSSRTDANGREFANGEKVSFPAVYFPRDDKKKILDLLSVEGIKGKELFIESDSSRDGENKYISISFDSNKYPGAESVGAYGISVVVPSKDALVRKPIAYEYFDINEDNSNGPLDYLTNNAIILYKEAAGDLKHHIHDDGKTKWTLTQFIQGGAYIDSNTLASGIRLKMLGDNPDEKIHGKPDPKYAKEYDLDLGKFLDRRPAVRQLLSGSQGYELEIVNKVEADSAAKQPAAVR